MVLSEQARRNWRVAAIVGTIAVGFQGLFYTDYNLPNKGEKHVLTDLQRNYHKFIDRHVFGINRDDQQSQQQQPAASDNDSNSKGQR